MIKMIEDLYNAEIIVIKIGTSSLVDANDSHSLDINVFCSFVEDVTHLWRLGKKIVIVTSGAVKLGERIDGGDVRAAASRGQAKLMEAYVDEFNKHGTKDNVGQMLFLKADFSKRKLNKTKNTLMNALDEGTIVIINENDPTSTKKTTLGDNDALAARITRLLEADALIILSLKDATLRGKGGFDAKLKAIYTVEAEDIRVMIVDGKREHIIRETFNGDKSGVKNVEEIKALARSTTSDRVKVKN